MQLFTHHTSIPGTFAKAPAATQLEDEVETAEVVVASIEEEVVVGVGVSGARSAVVAWVVVAWEGVLEVVVEAAAVLEEVAVDVVAVVVEAEVEEDISASTLVMHNSKTSYAIMIYFKVYFFRKCIKLTGSSGSNCNIGTPSKFLVHLTQAKTLVPIFINAPVVTCKSSLCTLKPKAV